MYGQMAQSVRRAGAVDQGHSSVYHQEGSATLDKLQPEEAPKVKSSP